MPPLIPNKVLKSYMAISMKSKNERLSCILTGWLISMLIVGMLIVLLVQVDHHKLIAWMAFVVSILLIIRLNMIYQRLIENVFRKLNQKEMNLYDNFPMS